MVCPKDDACMDRHNWTNASGGKGKSSAASQLAKAARIAEEMALQKAGAYSLRVVVRQAPVSSFPTALCWGSSLRTLYLCRKDIIAGKFTHMSSVGLGDLEPMRPCANFNLCTPGSICSTWTIGSFQIEAAPSKSVGSAGCSSMPTLPANAVSRSASREKHRRAVPNVDLPDLTNRQAVIPPKVVFIT